MHQKHDPKSFKTEDEQRDEHNRERAKSQQDYYGVNQAIYELLKDPVSLGFIGGNCNRGRQR